VGSAPAGGDTDVAQSCAMEELPLVIRELPTAEDVLERPLAVTGEFFLELFAGDSAFSLGVVMSQVPCLLPWDSKYGERFDVFRSGASLLALVKGGISSLPT
jgi:hypothetical protein